MHLALCKVCRLQLAENGATFNVPARAQVMYTIHLLLRSGCILELAGTTTSAQRQTTFVPQYRYALCHYQRG